MAYADRDRTGENTIGIVVSLVIVVGTSLLLMSGLAFEGFKKAIEKVAAVDIKKDEEKKEPEKKPPPEKKVQPPPVVVPPPKFNVAPPMPAPESVPVPPPPSPPIPQPAFTPAPPAAPPPKFTPTRPVPKGNPGNWATTNDYPAAAQREEREGTTRFSVTVSADGRVTGCTVTGSSGSSDLDATTCSKITSRGRFTPAKDGDGNPTTGSWSGSIRWQLPKD